MESNISKEELLIELSKDYYLKNIPITDLTKKYQLSRYKISKKLEEATSTGIVSISINAPFERNHEIESFFNKHFKTQVLVLKNIDSLVQHDINFWNFCAKTTQQMIADTSVVSLSWGDSVYKVIEQFKTSIQEDLIFTQFIGESGKYHSLAGSMRLVQKAASKYESRYLTLTAPLYIMSNEARELLGQEPILSKTITTARKSDILLTGLATPASITSVDAWNQNKELIFGPQFDNAIGIVYGRAYDIDGNFLNQSQDKTFGLTLAQILQIPKRVSFCNNKFKATACLGALNGNFFTHMIIDEKSALKIMKIMEKY